MLCQNDILSEILKFIHGDLPFQIFSCLNEASFRGRQLKYGISTLPTGLLSPQMSFSKCYAFHGLNFDSFGKKSKLLLSSDFLETENENKVDFITKKSQIQDGGQNLS